MKMKMKMTTTKTMTAAKKAEQWSVHFRFGWCALKAGHVGWSVGCLPGCLAGMWRVMCGVWRVACGPFSCSARVADHAFLATVIPGLAVPAPSTCCSLPLSLPLPLPLWPFLTLPSQSLAAARIPNGGVVWLEPCHCQTLVVLVTAPVHCWLAPLLYAAPFCHPDEKPCTLLKTTRQPDSQTANAAAVPLIFLALPANCRRTMFGRREQSQRTKKEPNNKHHSHNNRIIIT